jgi:ubiquinone/menaquinone biosynthesis C-methylase UbiE
VNKIQNPDYLRKEQYQDASRLEARINLHREFSTGQQNWFEWMLDRLELPDSARILEIGCGPGDLWSENLTRLPPGWDMYLTDFSEGMLERTRRMVDRQPARFKLAAGDARRLPFPDRTFQAVIANHMLYHVPDRPAALQEIHRVLSPGGKLFAATIGPDHLQDLAALVNRFEPGAAAEFLQAKNPFSLENGPDQLSEVFDRVQVFRHPSDLRVTEVNPLVEYVLSSFRLEVDKGDQEEFRAFLDRELQKNGGTITIRKDSGLLTASKPG